MLKIPQKKKEKSFFECINCKTIRKFYCKTCKNVYCQDCGTNHKTSFKDHKINNIDDNENKKLPKIEPKVNPIQINFNKINKVYKYNASEGKSTFDNHYIPSHTDPNDFKQEEEKKITDFFKKKDNEIKEKMKKVNEEKKNLEKSNNNNENYKEKYEKLERKYLKLKIEHEDLKLWYFLEIKKNEKQKNEINDLKQKLENNLLIIKKKEEKIKILEIEKENLLN